jgi:hypothetical protein
VKDHCKPDSCLLPWSWRLQEQRALGGAVAALGLSQKAVYADDEQPEAGGGDSVFNYSSGSDLAPNPAPSASAGMPASAHLVPVTCCSRT